MELTSGVVIILAVVLVVTFMLLRRGSHHDARPLMDAPHTLVKSNKMTTSEEGEPHLLVNWLLDRAFEQTGVRVADDALARERVVQAAAKAMEDLQISGSATISLPFLVADARGPKHFGVQFKRNSDSTFELQG